MQETRKNSSEKETRGKEKERDERNERKLAVYRATLSHSPIRARIVPVRRSSFKSLFSLTPVVGGRAEKGDEVKKKKKEEKEKMGGWAAGGRGDESHLQLNFSRAIHVHLFSSTATRIFVRANILAAWSGDEVVVSSPSSASLYFSFSLSSLPASCKLPGPTRGAQMRWKR